MGEKPRVLSAKETEMSMIIDFWNQYRIFDTLGGTNRGLLDELERIVTDCWYQNPPDLAGARSATAEAIYLLRSDSEV